MFLCDSSVNSVLKAAQRKIQHRERGEVTEKHRGFFLRQNVFVRLQFYAILIFTLSVIFNAACTPRAFEKPNAQTAPPSANENKSASTFEIDLQTMRTAGFEYIFVFRRKDGAAFDGEDRKYLRANAPAETNRFVSTDNEKAFIAGSKFPFPAPNLEALRLRFNIEDYSAAK